MNIEVFQADYKNPQHAQDIVRLMNIYAADGMGGGIALPEEVTRRLVGELARRSSALSVLAYAGKEAVGLVNCFEGFSTFAARPLMNIHDVVVSPVWRRRGVSRQMMTLVEKLAATRGCCKMTLEVLEGNSAARAVYTELGFKGFTLHPGMGQALFWQKIITP